MVSMVISGVVVGGAGIFWFFRFPKEKRSEAAMPCIGLLTLALALIVCATKLSP
ncbi:MAG: hypothetical protein UY41_C0027G0011 [Candidatus Moranbacteria bacterium GW2011_GWE1_49_15]|nr:MAG: hypothetical protein UY41_C0027G0011 [Candidatus Moranbacteria bacterium GW2011_GWE1_49_15]